MAKGKVAINLEYGALRFFCAFVNAVPYPLAMASARGLGWTLVHVFRFKRHRTETRIRSVFPAMSAKEVRRVATESLQNVLQTVSR